MNAVPKNCPHYDCIGHSHVSVVIRITSVHMHITTKVVNSITDHGDVYTILLYVIKFVCDLILKYYFKIDTNSSHILLSCTLFLILPASKGVLSINNIIG